MAMKTCFNSNSNNFANREDFYSVKIWKEKFKISQIHLELSSLLEHIESDVFTYGKYLSTALSLGLIKWKKPALNPFPFLEQRESRAERHSPNVNTKLSNIILDFFIMEKADNFFLVLKVNFQGCIFEAILSTSWRNEWVFPWFCQKIKLIWIFSTCTKKYFKKI